MLQGSDLDRAFALIRERQATLAEFIIMAEVADTVVVDRDRLIGWVAWNWRGLPRCPSDPELGDAIDGCIGKGWLIEFTPELIRQEKARWAAETYPKSWFVDLRWAAGDIDLTSSGEAWIRDLMRNIFGDHPRQAVSCSYDAPNRFEVFGETEPECKSYLEDIMRRCPDFISAHVGPISVTGIDPPKPIGPWWYDRFHLIRSGYRGVIHYETVGAAKAR